MYRAEALFHQNGVFVKIEIKLNVLFRQNGVFVKYYYVQFAEIGCNWMQLDAVGCSWMQLAYVRPEGLFLFVIPELVSIEPDDTVAVQEINSDCVGVIRVFINSTTLIFLLKRYTSTIIE